jgi:hypothetical protein
MKIKEQYMFCLCVHANTHTFHPTECHNVLNLSSRMSWPRNCWGCANVSCHGVSDYTNYFCFTTNRLVLHVLLTIECSVCLRVPELPGGKWCRKRGDGSGAIWNFGMSIVRCSSVAGLKIWNSVQVDVCYCLEFTVHQCKKFNVWSTDNKL